MAYILGFFAADGNLTMGKRKNYYVEFTSCDRVILEKIKHTLNSDHKISERTNRNHNWRDTYRLQIGSKTMFQSLNNFGFVPKKSKRLAYPQIPNKYFPDFLRGYFDGDGHVTTGSYKKTGRNYKTKIIFSGFTCGTKTFLQNIHRELLRRGTVRGGTLYYQKGFRLNFSINDSLSLYNLLYKDTRNNLYLSRKKKVFKKFFNR